MQKLFNTDNLFFMSSSGHCALTCPYCLIEPVAKNEPSLDRGDFKFLFEKFKNKKNGFIFSGKGDFFASYKMRDELLSFILEHDVEVMLDINGQFLQEYPHLPQDKINKIKQINITMHYHQLKEKSFLSKWARNVKVLYQMNPEVIIINTIMSPPLIHLWEEALSFYEKYIFQETRIKLLLICDVHVTSIGKFHEHEEKYLLELLKRFPFAYVLGDPDVMNLDFIEQFKPGKLVRCPAGQKYFRIWNDGTVQGCLPNEQISLMGNIKKREITINNTPIKCSDTRHCDCGWALLYSDLLQTSWWEKTISKVASALRRPTGDLEEIPKTP